MKKSFKKGNRFIVERAGIPMIAMLSANEHTQFIQEREEQFKIFGRIKSKLPDVPVEEIENDVRRVMRAVRKNT